MTLGRWHPNRTALSRSAIGVITGVAEASGDVAPAYFPGGPCCRELLQVHSRLSTLGTSLRPPLA